MKANKKDDYSLLRQLCAIKAPSGNETAMRDFVLEYVKHHSKKWKHKPRVIHGGEMQDNIILVFGKPRTAVFAHMDSIGFTVRYGPQLVRIGWPATESGYRLIGTDAKGTQSAELLVSGAGRQETLSYKAKRSFERGTELVFEADWREDKDHIQCCYLDNRLGVYCALRLAETLEHGAIVLSTREEHGGGSVAYLQKLLYSKYKIRQALICDVSWISDGVHFAEGPVISLRDSLIPRRSYVERVTGIARQRKCLFQLEVEGNGGSDARELQVSDNPWEWCFVGAPVENTHTPHEKVHKKDIEGMLQLYRVLTEEL